MEIKELINLTIDVYVERETTEMKGKMEKLTVSENRSISKRKIQVA